MATMPYKNVKSANDNSATDITARKYRPDQMESLNMIHGEQSRAIKRLTVAFRNAAEFVLVEVRLLRVSAARTLDDHICSVATTLYAVLNALPLNQLR